MAQLDLFQPQEHPTLPKPNSQNWKVLAALVCGRRYTALLAMQEIGCLRLGARIYDLIHDYHIPIDSELVQTQSGKRVSAYFIRSGEVRRELRDRMFRNPLSDT